MTNLIETLTANTQDLKSAFIQKTIENAKSTFDYCVKMYSMTLAEKFTMFNVPFEMVERLTGNGKELVATMQRVSTPYSKYTQTPTEYYTYQKQNDKWYTVRSLGLDKYIANELKYAEMHYETSILKLADRLTKKGITNEFIIESVRIGQNFEITITSGNIITRAWTIIAEGPIQRPHYRYLVK
jgi:hypothetical protein